MCVLLLGNTGCPPAQARLEDSVEAAHHDHHDHSHDDLHDHLASGHTHGGSLKVGTVVSVGVGLLCAHFFSEWKTLPWGLLAAHVFYQYLNGSAEEAVSHLATHLWYDLTFGKLVPHGGGHGHGHRH